MEIIELIDESGEVVEARLIDSFGMNEDDYVVFEALDGSELLYILKVEYEDDGDVFFVGVDEDELDDLIEVYEELKEEQEN